MGCKLPELLTKLETLDPSKNSLDSDLNIVGKKTFFGKVYSWILHILTLGFRSLNPDLDRAIDKTISIANKFLYKNTAIAEQDIKNLSDLFGKLKVVVSSNQGSRGTEVDGVIDKIRYLKQINFDELQDKASSNTIAETLKFIETFKSYFKEKFEFKGGIRNSAKVENLKLKLMLMLHSMKFFDSERDELYSFLYDLDDDSFNQILLLLKPNLITSLINFTFTGDKYWKLVDDGHKIKRLLNKFVRQFITLPKDHPNLLAFIHAIPLNYQENILFQKNLIPFLLSDDFTRLLKHLDKSDRLHLFQNFPKMIGKFLEISFLDGNEIYSINNLLDNFPKHRELILRGIAQTENFEFFESFRGKDAEIIADVWAQNPSFCSKVFCDNKYIVGSQHPFDHPAGCLLLKKLIAKANGEQKDELFHYDSINHNGVSAGHDLLTQILTQELDELIQKDQWQEAKDHYDRAHMALKRFLRDKYNLIEGLDKKEREEREEEIKSNTFSPFHHSPTYQELRRHTRDFNLIESWHPSTLSFVEHSCRCIPKDGLYAINRIRDKFASTKDFEFFLKRLPSYFLEDFCRPFGFYLNEAFTDAKSLNLILSRIENFGNEKLTIDWLHGKLKAEDLVKAIISNEIKPICLDSLFNDAETSDLTLVVEGKEIKAHKFILASALKYFKDGFDFDKNLERIDISECSYEGVFKLIKLVYNKDGHFSNPYEDDFNFYEDRDYLNLYDDKDLLETLKYFNGAPRLGL